LQEKVDSVAMTINTSDLWQKSILSDYFSLSIKQDSKNTKIKMRLFTEIVNTRDIPATYDLLSRKLPGVFTSDCFNEENLSFSQEVKETEIGHLFEHILLENLCKLTSLRGNYFSEFSGETSWDWRKGKKGTFDITLDVGFGINDIFLLALERSVSLTNQIIKSRTSDKFDLG